MHEAIEISFLDKILDILGLLCHKRSWLLDSKSTPSPKYQLMGFRVVLKNNLVDHTKYCF